MKILVTGGNGQVGHALDDGPTEHKILALCRTEFDLSDPNLMDDVLRTTQPDMVINTAAWTDVDNAEDHPKQAALVNGQGAADLANICHNNNISLIHLSTDYVFGGAGTNPWNEDDRPAPQSVYGVTKLAGEQLVAQANPKAAIVRTSWVYGPHAKNFLKTMLRLAKTKQSISVVKDQIGCPTYAPHLAQALLDLAEKVYAGQNCGILHLAGTGCTTWSDFAKEIFSRSANTNLPSAEVIPIPSSQFPTKAKRPANSALDCTKAQTDFGIHLPNWQDGVRDCLLALQPDK